MENLNTEKIATFQLNNEFVTIKLDQIHLMMLKSEGLKSLIHRLRGDVWVSLKLRGEKLTIRELKFKGIEQQYNKLKMEDAENPI